jgi:hypothetical protein
MEDCKAIGVPLDPKTKLKGYWKQLENKQEMKDSRFMKWNNCVN